MFLPVSRDFLNGRMILALVEIYFLTPNTILMKKKTISLGRKLVLNKAMIATLNNNQQDTIMGGATFAPGCVGSNHCTALDCTVLPITKDELCTQNTKECA